MSVFHRVAASLMVLADPLREGDTRLPGCWTVPTPRGQRRPVDMSEVDSSSAEFETDRVRPSGVSGLSARPAIPRAFTPPVRKQSYQRWKWRGEGLGLSSVRRAGR